MIIFNGHKTSVIHRIDPRLRVITAMTFAVMVVLSERVVVLFAALAVVLATAVTARLGARQIAKRLGELNVFMAMLFVFLPVLMPGQPLFTVGPLVYTREGFERAAIMALRANAIMVAMVALLTTMPPAHLGFALYRLGCPRKLVHVLLFMVRYVEVVHREYHRLRDAMKLRAFRAKLDKHTLRTLGYLVGQLLVRSIDRSERVLQAMKCRGFRGRLYVVEKFAPGLGDALFAVASGAFLVLLGWIEWR